MTFISEDQQIHFSLSACPWFRLLMSLDGQISRVRILLSFLLAFCKLFLEDINVTL